MGRPRKVEVVNNTHQQDTDTEVLDINTTGMLTAEQMSKISDKIEFTGLEDKFRFFLKLSEPSREYTKVEYKGKTIKVIPLAYMSSSEKFVLKDKENHIFSAKLTELK